eukprot:5088116-Ditylum_brightwellii.AAC.1
MLKKSPFSLVALVTHGDKLKLSFGESTAWVQSPFGLLVVEMWDMSCIEEASRSTEPSGRRMYVVPP